MQPAIAPPRVPDRPQLRWLVPSCGLLSILSFLFPFAWVRASAGDVCATGVDAVVGQMETAAGALDLGGPSLALSVALCLVLGATVAAALMERRAAAAAGLIGFATGFALLVTYVVATIFSTPPLVGVGPALPVSAAAILAGMVLSRRRLAADWRNDLPEAVAAYVEPAPLAALFLGMSSGFPFAMIGATLTSRLAQDGVNKSTVTAFALTFLAYNLKWAWAPVVDKFRLPLLGRLGQRVSWLVVAAVLVIASVAWLASLDARSQLEWMVVAAIAVGVSGATYDIVIDAYRIELLEPRQLGAGSGMSQYGWRIGSASAGALALVVAQGSGWTAGYLACTVFALPAVVTGLVMGEPSRHVERTWARHIGQLAFSLFLVSIPIVYYISTWLDWLLGVQILSVMVVVGFVFPLFDLTARRARTVGWSPALVWLLILPIATLLLILGTGWSAAPAKLAAWSAAGGLQPLATFFQSAGAIVIDLVLGIGAVLLFALAVLPDRVTERESNAADDPFGEFFARRGAWLVLLFVLVHKIGDTLANLTLRLLFDDIGFTNKEIAFYDVGVGFVALLLGVFVGGLMYARMGLKSSVMVSLILMGVSNLSFAGLAVVGHNNAAMAGAMFFENFSSGVGGVAVVAYLSALCSLTFTATQYAMLSAAASVIGRLVTGLSSGAAIQGIGYVNFYLLTTLAAVPGIVIFWIMIRLGLVDAAMGDAGTTATEDAPGTAVFE